MFVKGKFDAYVLWPLAKSFSISSYMHCFEVSCILVKFMLSKELVFVFTLMYENNIFRSDNRGELREEDKSQVWFVHKIFN